MQLSKYTIIKASAGSGKTYTLTKELAERLSSDRSAAPPLHPSQIIATTFTRKAAQELSTRIREQLVEYGMLKQAAAMPAALVGTVNSVTGRILQDFAMDIGMSPDVQVLTDTAQRQAFRHATDDIIATAEQQHRALLTRTRYDRPDASSFQNSGNHENWGETIRNLVELARTNDLDATTFAEYAQQSIADLQSLLADPDAQDARPQLVENLRATVRQVEAEIADGKLATGSIRTNETAVNTVTTFLRRLEQADLDHFTWKEWFDLAVWKSPARFRDVFAEQTPAVQLEKNPKLLADLTELIQLVFTTAADCMTAYQQHKEALGLIDFTDQEHLTLALLRSHEAVRASISERYRILAVDEFQDTNPLQLALFTELANLVDEVLWVGDPKQSIYQFRGADPALMQTAVETIADGGGQTRVLDRSWRTHEVPLGLSNQIFSTMFPGMDPDTGKNPDVWLEVAEPKRAAHAGGSIEFWHEPNAKTYRSTIAQWQRMILRGILELKLSDQRGGSIAVLTASNSHAAQLRTLLLDHGITVAGGGTPLLETREGVIVRAAIAWILDEQDTQALIELIKFLHDHEAHADWLQQLTGLPTLQDRKARLQTWCADPSLRGLTDLRTTFSDLTVPELVESVIDVLDLKTRIAGWARVTEGNAALAGLLRFAQQYVGEDQTAAPTTTASDFLHALAESVDASTQAPSDPEAVYVDTIHQAKGLEWDTVIIALPSHRSRFKAAEQWVHDDGQAVELESPLAGRQLRFWPTTILDHPELKSRAAQYPDQVKRLEALELEYERHLYVAMTRSVYRTVLAPNCGLEKLSAFVSGRTTVQSRQDDSGVLEVTLTAAHSRVAPVTIELEHKAFSEDADELRAHAARLAPGATAATLMEDRAGRPVEPVPILPARMLASANRATDALRARTEVHHITTLGEAIASRGGMDWNLVGDCLHAYLALPYALHNHTTKLRLAQRLIDRFAVSENLSAADIVAVGDRWTQWHDARYPGSSVRTEVPFTWTSPTHQRAQGWFDQITNADGGHIVIDHKSYPGTEPVEEILTGYLGQLDIYQDALAASTGAAPVELLVHMPVRGEVYSVKLPDS